MAAGCLLTYRDFRGPPPMFVRAYSASDWVGAVEFGKNSRVMAEQGWPRKLEVGLRKSTNDRAPRKTALCR